MEVMMKRTISLIAALCLCVPLLSAAAPAATAEDTVRVGLYYSGGSNGALVSANLENYSGTGSGYDFGYYDGNRQFVRLGGTAETQISMSQDLNLYISNDGSYTTAAQSGAEVIGCFHLQLNEHYGSFDQAASKAASLKNTYGAAFPAYVDGGFVVRVGSYTSRADAQAALDRGGLDAYVESGSSYTVTVTKTGTAEILFEYDGGGDTYLAVEPRATGSQEPQTWFKGYRYYGGFEYDRSPSLSGGMINVINVVDLEDYVKGVITYEMSSSWPQEALKAQAICARTFAVYQTKHNSRNFDVCASTDCQVYRGTSASTSASDAAVEATAGLLLYYGGELVEPYYYSSNGGASENSENVWTAALPYLRGKADPYEASITIPNYSYEKTYTADELTSLLQKKGYDIGTVASVKPTYTAMGNIYTIEFTDTAGKSVTVRKESCRLLFSVPSMRFTISAGGSAPVQPGAPGASASGGPYYINSSGSQVSSLDELYLISGNGSVSQYNGAEDLYVLTSAGKAALGSGESGGTTTSGASVSGNTYVIQGTGSGHNVGMSQYGAYAMAQQGKTFRDILTFYYTGVTIQ